MSDNDDMVHVNVKVPREIRDGAKSNLEHGEMSEEIRNRLQEIAFGPERNQRSRLERRREDLKSDLRDKRNERRGLDAEIEEIEDKIQAVDEKLATITEKEDKYEALLEELEAKLREEGVRLFAEFPAVGRAADAGGVKPEGVIKTLKERNPDVPDHAFREGDRYGRGKEWNGLRPEIANRPPEDRERSHRGRK